MCGVVIARFVPRPSVAAFAGKTGGATLGIDYADLAQIAGRIGFGQFLQHILGRLTDGHKLEAFGAVGGVGIGLRGHRADASLGPGHDGADSEKFALHRHTQIARGGIEGDNGIRSHGAFVSLGNTAEDTESTEELKKVSHEESVEGFTRRATIRVHQSSIFAGGFDDR